MVKILIFLDLAKTISFLDRHYIGLKVLNSGEANTDNSIYFPSQYPPIYKKVLRFHRKAFFIGNTIGTAKTRFIG